MIRTTKIVGISKLFKQDVDESVIVKNNDANGENCMQYLNWGESNDFRRPDTGIKESQNKTS